MEIGRVSQHRKAKSRSSVGVCPAGFCCSQSGFCGQSRSHCDVPQCQFGDGRACDKNARPEFHSTDHRNLARAVPYGWITTCTQENTLALTFDDGPNIWTADLLNILDSYNAKATFFLTGDNQPQGPMDNPSSQWPALIQRVHQAGHQIASHTWTHPDLNTLSQEGRKTEMIQVEGALLGILGFYPTYMRPPFLECNDACLSDMQSLGYRVIGTDVDTKDFLYLTPDEIHFAKERFDDALHAKGIVLSHDTLDQTVHSLAKYMLEKARQHNLKVVTVGECLGDPRENWYSTNPVRLIAS
ncbi:carbohydrate esterase family 4 protein [Eremomyces bilateralis CBS 781.70]|uniref:Carbohydrate esterase family 4 protein n=1 Tax=Eremomyces bilateralis CBS 781.70 TaxID=1392243 RepID=A0A6G1G120_9PEZI|nr:carbohydrate esterase family 4 protein [Eremomyces bilateralis CBS 781.70]KAF1811682.1 carbohydrate esterase family 4 protein [Eremomyces bilateralis CBS 781.70]